MITDGCLGLVVYDVCLDALYVLFGLVLVLVVVIVRFDV